MASKFVSAFVSADFLNNYTAKVKTGKFTLVNNATLTANVLGGQFSTNVELSSDFTCVGANVRPQIVGTSSSYAGMNKAYISEDGVLNAGAALTEFARSGVEKRVVKEDTLALLGKHTQRDSHEAFLYNMLVSWMNAELYKSTGGSNDEFKVQGSAYEDSHCAVDYNGMLGGMTETVEIGPPVDDDTIEASDWTNRDAANYWSRPYVIHYNAASSAQETFYLYHVLGRNIPSRLNYVIDLPGLDTGEVLLDPINSIRSGPATAADVPWDRPNQIWMWIMDYVKLNRLEQQFATSLELLGSLVYQPKWSSVEACHWQKAAIVPVIPTFAPTRARIRVLLEGEPYVPSLLHHEFVMEEKTIPQNFLMASAYLNYAMWYGYYTLYVNAAEDADDWFEALGTCVGGLENMKSPAARAVAISVVTGKEVSTCFSESCGMFIETELMRSGRHIHLAENKDNTFGDTVDINYLPAPVSGSLLLGTAASGFTTTQHLAGLQHVKTDVESLSYDDALILSNAYRLFGHDVKLKDLNTGHEVAPWARPRECVVEPASVSSILERDRGFKILASDSREGRSTTLPNLAILHNTSSFVLTISKPYIRICEFQQRKRPIMSVFTRRRSRPVNFKVRASFTFKTSSFTASPVTRQAASQDFRDGGSDLTAVMPVPIPEIGVAAVSAQEAQDTATTVG